MEIAIAIFLGAWMCAAVVVAYIRLKKDYKEILDEDKRKSSDAKKEQK